MTPPLPASPSALLDRVLASLAPGDADAAAADILAVATPRFAQRVGSARDLARHLANASNAPLLGHVAVRRGPVERIEGAARQRIDVETADGDAAAFVVAFTRDGDGWRLSGLVRAGPAQSRAGPAAATVRRAEVGASVRAPPEPLAVPGPVAPYGRRLSASRTVPPASRVRARRVRPRPR